MCCQGNHAFACDDIRYFNFLFLIDKLYFKIKCHKESNEVVPKLTHTQTDSHPNRLIIHWSGGKNDILIVKLKLVLDIITTNLEL